MLFLDGKPGFELSFPCGTCQVLFRRRGADSFSINELSQRLAEGLTELDPEVLQTFGWLLPAGEYVPMLSEISPRLVIPGGPDDYFSHEPAPFVWYYISPWGAGLTDAQCAAATVRVAKADVLARLPAGSYLASSADAYCDVFDDEESRVTVQWSPGHTAAAAIRALEADGWQRRTPELPTWVADEAGPTGAEIPASDDTPWNAALLDVKRNGRTLHGAVTRDGLVVSVDIDHLPS
jgi:hypothetical protein